MGKMGKKGRECHTNPHHKTPLSKVSAQTNSRNRVAAKEAYKDEQPNKGHVTVAEAAGCHAYRRDDDKHQLDAIEPGASIVIGEEPPGQLTDYGAQEGEKIDEKAGVAVMREIDIGYGGGYHVGGEKVIGVGQKARCGHTPNSQIPVIQIQFVAKLAAIL